jgi:hypothetical protein
MFGPVKLLEVRVCGGGDGPSQLNESNPRGVAFSPRPQWLRQAHIV